MLRRERSCQKRLSRDDFEHIFICIDTSRACLRYQFAPPGTKRAPEDIGFDSTTDILATGHTLCLGHLFEPPSQFFRQTNRKRLPHVRHCSARLSESKRLGSAHVVVLVYASCVNELFVFAQAWHEAAKRIVTRL